MFQNNLSTGIIAGEDIDMPADFIQKHDIKIYNYSLIWDGVLQNRDDIYKKMREFKNDTGKGTPRTSQPSVGLFKELFENTLKEYDQVFVITISSKLSGCYSCALQALQQLDADKQKKIHIFDSLSSSSGSAFLVQKLIEDISAGISAQIIIKNLTSLREKVNLVAMIEDSYWLQKGGRLSPALAIVVNQMKKLGIRPLLAAKDGKIVLLKVKTNSSNKPQGLYDHIHSEIGDKSAELIITHADIALEATTLESLLKEKKPNIKILYVNQLSPVFGAHVGPDTLVVGWRILE